MRQNKFGDIITLAVGCKNSHKNFQAFIGANAEAKSLYLKTPATCYFDSFEVSS